MMSKFLLGTFGTFLAGTMLARGPGVRPWERPPSREDIISWLARQEDSVRTVACVFERQISKTDPSLMPLIQNLAFELGDPHWQEWVLSEEIAKARSTTNHWWRKDRNERWKVFT